MKTKFWVLISLLVVAGMILAACGVPPATQPPAATEPQPTQPPAPVAKVEIRYMLWDANQLPPYQACTDIFMKNNPNISVKIEQLGWDEYWKTLQTEFVTGAGPDVFTNQLNWFPEFVTKNQLVDIQPLVDADKIDTKVYLGGLTDLWVKEGKRYGLPKDWDTVAVVYNKGMLEKAGVTFEELNSATWNPTDGGTFQQIMAKLSVDKNGNNGLSPNFDPKNVVQYGYAPGDLTSGAGQTGWGNFAYSNGWKINDGPWAIKYYYDDPKLIETVDWLKSMIDKGFMPPYADWKTLGGSAFFASGTKAALTTNGSWMISWFASNTNFPFGFALLPEGPAGRKSMFNGLADSIYVGSKHQKEGWAYLKFLASEECEKIVGSSGVVFPALQSGVDASMKKHADEGLDVTPYTQIAKPETTYLYPIADHSSEVTPIMSAAFDSIYLGEKSAADALKEANQKVNDLFK